MTAVALRAPFDAFARIAGKVLTEDVLALVARLGVAAIFFQSGRTKVDGLLHIKDSTYSLFETEYHVPLLSPDVAAHAATYSEHLFSILLVVGLVTRLSALAFLGMTDVQFVYAEGLAMGPQAEQDALASAHVQIDELDIGEPALA